MRNLSNYDHCQISHIYSISLEGYHIVVFSRYLNFTNGRFSVFSRFYFHEWVCQKLRHRNGSTVYIDGVFEGLNFTNDQHSQNSWNLHILKEPTILYLYAFI